MCNIDFSVIIPQKDSLNTLPRLFDSIPNRNNIEIILINNSSTPLSKKQIGIERDFKTYWCPLERYAGGARNIGMEKARGKWLIFADADDFFSNDAFDIFFSCLNSSADVIYFSATGINPETGEFSNSADIYTNLVRNYLRNKKDVDIRVSFHVPWAKMVKREFVIREKFQFDEVIANNDDYFAMLIGLNASKIEAIDKSVYFYTVTRGSLTKRREQKVLEARLLVILRKNKYLRDHQLSDYQGSTMFLLYEMLKVGLMPFIKGVKYLIKYRQNPFIGYRNWLKTYTRKYSIERKHIANY